MNQKEFQAKGNGQSQCARILRALRSPRRRWVSMVDLWRASGAFAVHSRISDLRKAGWNILHKNERQVDGTIHSFYRLT